MLATASKFGEQDKLNATATSDLLNTRTLDAILYKGEVDREDEYCVQPQIKKLTLDKFEQEKQANLKLNLDQKPFVRRIDVR